MLAAARAAGIARVITVGTTLESSRWSAACAAEYDEVYAAVAIHPNDTVAAVASALTADEVLAEAVRPRSGEECGEECGRGSASRD